VKLKGTSPSKLAEHIVTDPAELAIVVEKLAECRRFGLDTEFVGEKNYHPQLCLVQIATEDALYLLDPLTVGSLDAFWHIVVSPRSEVIVHAGREEARLCYLACGKMPTNIVDLQLAAGLAGLAYPLGHGALVKEVLGVALAKGETLTEWATRPLTKSQIHYAFDDVRYLLPVWNKLSARLDKLGRHEWAKEEFARLVAGAKPHAPDDPAAPEKWRKLRGVGSLDRRRLAIVRELFTWRETAAAKHNRPPRTVIRDDLLLEIARRGPTKERDLHVVRGLPRRDLDAVIEAVQRGRDVPLEECPVPAERDLDPPQVAMVTSILMAVLGDVCAKQQLASNLVAATQDVKLVVRTRLQDGKLPPDSLLSHGWRKQHVLPELLAVLEGRRAIRVADVTADGPLEYDEPRNKPEA
jgi:ribonuclease D